MKKTTGKTVAANIKTFDKDVEYVANPTQLGGIELFSTLDGPGYPNRVAWVNTGSGLHYKVTIDRGLDIAEAFYKGQSLAWLSLSGSNRPEMSRNRGLDWLWGFYGGLLASCGPSFVGAPGMDNGQELSLHGRHSNLSATLESVINADPLMKQNNMSITGIVREAKLFEPNIELRRTISSPLGSARIEIDDTFYNRGTIKTEHAWLMHMNFGYPLVEEGTELIFKGNVQPLPSAVDYFSKRNFRIAPKPMHEHDISEAVAYIDPEVDRNGMVYCGLINDKRGFGIRLSFLKKDFPRIANWHHFGTSGQYVMGIEPANCGVQGRAKDREQGWLKFLNPGEKKHYHLTLEVLEGKDALADFRKQMK